MKEKNFADSTLFERLTELTKRGFSKSEMARIADVTPQSVNGWFKKGVISKKSAIAIAEATGVSVAWLLGDNVEESSGLNPDEMELLKLYRQLPEVEQKNMMAVFSARLKEIDDYVEKYLRGRYKPVDK
ncbi:TPA: helix-turn-helix domain-containing protein [Serratia marcescens]|uniref:helix-turn-helix domain-containing protein n=1 Tax=Serratia TaxID=613 RepID=UPI0018D678CA|nr:MULTISPECIES: helix-turn-helix domain-containing protein [Serratia]MBH2533840.1 helix-turn-helix domain-containing protein [Serratia marcescens]MDI6977544.1 helix-turn-helix domain-containing protein [Serratia sp. Se-RSBMAAmG]MDI9262422.1 helix-turn-helix domain-containing protein [Serratia sp. PF2-63]MDI9271275.1 helix-turn-helix domain-containing protein [Serratia sp. PF-27]HEJ7270072.1 helix-turn-helix domain-containing protein [Serratia marcescens]